MKPRVLAIILLCVFLAFVAWKRTNRSPSEAKTVGSANGESRRHSSDQSLDIPPGSGGVTGKSLERPEQQEVTMEMTLEQLRKPLEIDVNYPQQRLRERISAMNASLKEAGIPARLLRIRVNETYSRKEDVLELMAGEIRLRRPDPAEILKYTCESVRLDYTVQAGTVVLRTEVEDK